MEVVEKRKSNFEIMRIISMLMIIFWHIMYHGGVYYNSSGTLRIVLNIIKPLILVHVNSFILVTGYFSYDKKFKMSKVIKLNNSMWFYKSIIPIVLIILGYYSMDSVSYIKALSPISHYDYWFISTYLYLYLCTPMLNILINNLNKSNYKKMLFLLFTIFSIVPFITNQKVLDIQIGYSILQFVFLYFIGAYIKKYDVINCYYLKRINNNSKKILFLFLYITLGLFLGLVTIASSKFENTNSIFEYIGQILYSSGNEYNSPFLIIESIFYFLFFSLININSNFINKISKTTIGVYLIHDLMQVRDLLWKNIGFNKPYYSFNILWKMIFVTISVFCICSIIEYIRQLIFNFIYHRKISCKFRKFYRGYLDSLGVDIRW